METNSLTIAELLPCPFCGGKAELYKQYARCSNNECGVTLAATVEEWNTRATMRAEAAEEVSEEELVAVLDMEFDRDLGFNRNFFRRSIHALRSAGFRITRQRQSTGEGKEQG